MALSEYFAIGLFLLAILGLLTGFPVAFTLAGSALFVVALAALSGAFEISLMGAIPSRIFGTAMWNEVLLAVPLFIFMGLMLERSRVAASLLENMGLLFGRLRGGLGISVFVVGALLAASTGIVGAAVVTMGLMALPTMLKHGYDPKLAAGSIAASGTLGQIIPPSIVLIILGEQISNAYVSSQNLIGNWSPEPVSVGDLFAGAIFPGLMLVGLYIGYQIVVAIITPERSPALITEANTEKGFLLKLLGALLAPIALMLAVLGSILMGIATPTEAASVGGVGSILLAGMTNRRKPILWMNLSCLSIPVLLVVSQVFDLRIAPDGVSNATLIGLILAIPLIALTVIGILVSLKRLLESGILQDVCLSTMQMTSMVFVILIGATLFSLVFRGLGGDEIVYEALKDLPGGKYGALFVVMLVIFMLGFFLDFVEICFVVVPIVAPVILLMDVNPVWLGVLIALNLQTSFLTPPFGFALFYLRRVAPAEITTGTIYKGVLPFVLLQLSALAILAAFPALATWLPETFLGSQY
jgi:tripartite ATP-independent transporter DctM subunit